MANINGNFKIPSSQITNMEFTARTDIAIKSVLFYITSYVINNNARDAL